MARELRDLRAIRPFMYNSKSYSTGQLFQAYDPDASNLVAKRCAEFVSIAPGTPVTTPIEGETKELKVSRVAKKKK